MKLKHITSILNVWPHPSSVAEHRCMAVSAARVLCWHQPWSLGSVLLVVYAFCTCNIWHLTLAFAQLPSFYVTIHNIKIQQDRARAQCYVTASLKQANPSSELHVTSAHWQDSYINEMSHKPSKQGQTDLFFGSWSGFINTYVHAGLQVSRYSGYDLCHPG